MINLKLIHVKEDTPQSSTYLSTIPSINLLFYESTWTATSSKDLRHFTPPEDLASQSCNLVTYALVAFPTLFACRLC